MRTGVKCRLCNFSGTVERALTSKTNLDVKVQFGGLLVLQLQKSSRNFLRKR